MCIRFDVSDLNCQTGVENASLCPVKGREIEVKGPSEAAATVIARQFHNYMLQI